MQNKEFQQRIQLKKKPTSKCEDVGEKIKHFGSQYDVIVQKADLKASHMLISI